jgi:hypothetical protein
MYGVRARENICYFQCVALARHGMKFRPALGISLAQYSPASLDADVQCCFVKLGEFK